LNRLTRKDALIVAALIVVCIIAALPVVTYPMGRDQGMYANIARSMLDGGLPFVDMWDIKPPAIYYLYALNISIFGGGSAALRALDLITVPFTLMALYWLALRLTNNRRVGVLGGVLFTVFYFTETFASLTQSDAVVTLPMTLAALSTVRAGDHPRGTRGAVLWAFAAGSLCALTLWFKHYYAIFVLVLVLHHLITRWRSFPIKEILGFSLGGLIFGGLPLLYFLSNGVFDEMMIVAQGTARYNAQAAVSFSAFIDQMRNYVEWRLSHWGVLLVLAALWFMLPGLNRKGWRVVLLWLAAGLAFVLVQAKGFDTHWIPMLPPLALLGAAASDRLLQIILSGLARLPEKRLMPLLYGLAIAALFLILLKDTWIRAYPYLSGQQGLYAYYEQHFQANDLKPWQSLRAIRYINRHTQPGDTLFVWGFRPEIYYLTELRPATRFQAHFPLVSEWYPPEWKQENVDQLWATMPAYALILQADYMPWVTGKNKDSHEMLVEYTELDNWLNANYERDTQIGDFLIWRRK
jgi:4-amino-4-deoxy-L-arabinose transferase-like glycosyltransferase